ncbi:MAG: SPOR domain-containing protein [Thiohalorhabdaceae bacterium]
MSAPGKNQGAASDGRRLYKLIGALVVALVIAAALIPLWLGGDQEQQAQTVEVQPEELGAADRGDSSPSPERRQNAEGSEPEATAEGETGEWWQPQGAGDSANAGAGKDRPEESANEEAAPAPESASAESAKPEGPSEVADKEEASAARDQESDPGADEEAPAAEQDSREGAPEAVDAGQSDDAERPFWTVMTGSFRDPGNARGLKDRLDEQGFTVEVVTRTIEGREWHRVYAGREGSRQEAEQVMSRLREAGYDELLVLKAE